MGLFSKTPAPVALDPKLSDLSIRELCRRRDALEAELSARARVLAADFSMRYGSERRECSLDSKTVISLDGSTVLVAWFETNRWRCTTTTSTPPLRFPFIGWDKGPDGECRWDRQEHVPLAVYEVGSAAVHAMFAEEEAESRRKREQWDREEYEKLKAKFG